MAEMTAEHFAQTAFNLNLIDERQLHAVWGELGTRDVSLGQIQQLLLRRSLLTNFQIERMIKGERTGYFYGDYKVLYLAGTGTFSRVYRAVHKESGKIVAVKVLRKRFSDDPQQVSQFVGEAEMGAKLRHPNIVPVYEYYSKAFRHYMVMDFIEGQTLREFLKIRSKFLPQEATKLLLDVATGLTYAFDRGITHRDLKLTNVLVTSRGQAKLVDFGLAAADQDRNVSNDTISSVENPRTIDYAGLERATGVRKDDARSDIYFAGCIYYHLLTGQPPLYETKNRIERLSKARFTSVEPIQRIDPNLPAVVLHIAHRAMEIDPERRYQTPAELKADLTVACQKLSAGDGHEAGLPDATEAVVQELEKGRATLSALSSKPTLMFVDSSVSMQNLFRRQLRDAGFRVLVISDPDRAQARFEADDVPADCVIFSTRGLGKRAAEAFHRWGADPRTEEVKAILLLDKRHQGWEPQIPSSRHRLVLKMPMKLKRFEQVLNNLVLSEGN